ncbi:MAG TPA: hypothetical protein IGS52_11520 [Oscillatoriaceae cyanobacterium M33_DOE_052]|uniref:Uncharacterized protein n=1 Tax=Planktothricoides sp. SpSt-374 TaxID=2282167 RepID=A0A7C3ZK22_9CYAN|nr:hypothetical protein [Oscillatoriaceae cyanobacterium M33_DOE_052]
MIIDNCQLSPPPPPLPPLPPLSSVSPSPRLLVSPSRKSPRLESLPVSPSPPPRPPVLLMT